MKRILPASMFRSLHVIHATIRTTSKVEVIPPKNTPTTIGIELLDSQTQSSKRVFSASKNTV